MAYSHAEDVDQNVNRGEKSEEVILHHSFTRFRMHHMLSHHMASRLEVTSSHGQLIGDMEEHLSMLDELWLPSDGANCQLSTWTPGMGHFPHHGIESEAKIFTF